MSADDPTVDWNQLHDRFYRKHEVYSMLWQGQIDLAKYNVSAAPFGGPMALVREDKKTAQKQSAIKPVVSFYSSAGDVLNQIQMEKGKIAGMGWTDTEHWICITEEGIVRKYSIQGDFTQFSLGKEAKENLIIDCQIWPTGFVAMTGNFKLIAVTNLDDPRPKQLCDPGLNEPPHCWAVIEPRFSENRRVEVLLATRNTILVVDANDVQDRQLTRGPFSKISLSPNGKFLAMFTSDGKLWVMSIDFNKTLSEFDTKSKLPPKQLVWCGVDSVILYWDKLLLMIGPFGDWIKYSYDDALVLVPEIDGVRIITNEKCEFLQKVPDFTEDIFKIGSTAPAAMLYDAFNHFEKKSPKADENIRSIRSELTDAVDACIDAAGHEWDTRYQTSLLKAASFGKCFLDFYNSDRFVEVCKVLRILNSIRRHEIGIPITYTQFNALKADVVIDRLINRHQHFLALRVCEYLKLWPHKVLIHWACEKIKRSEDDDKESLCRSIVNKLAEYPGISYTEIAKTAHKYGHPRLATRLLDYESRAADQVPLLLSLQEDELALAKATESGDADLIYLVLLHLKRKLPMDEFFRMVSSKPLAYNLLEVYCSEQDPQLLKDFYFQDDRHLERAMLVLKEGSAQQDVSKMIANFRIAQELLAHEKEVPLVSKLADDEVKLLQAQVALEKELNDDYVNLSVTSTILKLLLARDGAKALKFKNDFKISEKKWYWLKIRSLAQLGDWEELDKFCKLKRPPVGYAAFVDECIRRNANAEAAKYIQRCNVEERPPLYMRIGQYREAGEIAVQLKDLSLLQDIRMQCKNKEMIPDLDSMIAQLNQRR